MNLTTILIVAGVGVGGYVAYKKWGPASTGVATKQAAAVSGLSSQQVANLERLNNPFGTKTAPGPQPTNNQGGLTSFTSLVDKGKSAYDTGMKVSETFETAKNWASDLGVFA